MRKLDKQHAVQFVIQGDIRASSNEIWLVTLKFWRGTKRASYGNEKCESLVKKGDNARDEMSEETRSKSGTN